MAPPDVESPAPTTPPRRRRGARLLIVLIALWAGSAAADDLGGPLLVPVAGVRPAQLHSTFGAPRGGGRRRHQGVDIFAPRGRAVRAAQSGLVVRVGTNRLGGKVVWTVGERGLLCYYAHLDRWAPGLAAGQLVRRGQRLGSVGNTGNARTTRPHLHFETRPLHRGLMAVDPVPVLGGEVVRRRR